MDPLALKARFIPRFSETSIAIRYVGTRLQRLLTLFAQILGRCPRLELKARLWRRETGSCKINGAPSLLHFKKIKSPFEAFQLMTACRLRRNRVAEFLLGGRTGEQVNT